MGIVQVPKPHHVLETHAAVVAETWSHPDATNQPLVTPVLNRTRTDSAGFLSREGSYALEASAAASSGAPGMKRVESWKDESQPVLSTASATSPKPKQPSMLDLSANAPNAASEPMPDAKPPQPAGNLTGAGITSPSTLAVILGGDQWVYRDPQLQIQGPFTKQDLVEWFDAGFFPQVISTCRASSAYSTYCLFQCDFPAKTSCAHKKLQHLHNSGSQHITIIMPCFSLLNTHLSLINCPAVFLRLLDK